MKWSLIPQGLCLAGAFVSFACHGVTLYGGAVHPRLTMAMIWFVGALFLVVNYRALWKVLTKPFDKSVSHPISKCPLWMLMLIILIALYAMLDSVIYGRLGEPESAHETVRQSMAFLVLGCWMSFCCLYGEQKSRGQSVNESTENR